jgi:hypothetical protein
MRAFWAAVSLVNGGSGGRDMMDLELDDEATLSPYHPKSMADRLSADH